MDAATTRLALPYLEAGQAQKELTHNEALARLDLLVQASVASVGANTPPANPAEGRCDVIGSSPIGAWDGRAGSIAGWTVAGWRFVTPREGMAVWSEADGVVARYAAGAWQVGAVTASAVRIGGLKVVGTQRPAIPDTVGGATIDQEARATLAAILGSLRAHGLIAI